jgi:hypothetical protein
MKQIVYKDVIHAASFMYFTAFLGRRRKKRETNEKKEENLES